MGFFARLKWLFTGEGESPSSFKPAVTSSRRPEPSHSRQGYQGRDRHPRERGGEGRDRDSRGGRHHPRERGSEGRDRDLNQRHSQSRDGGDRDRFADRERGQGPRRPDRHHDRHSPRRNHSNSEEFSRPVDRPSGGPSSTMRPAQSSAQDAVSVAPRIEQQGPEKVGVVTHYFDQARVASIKIEKGGIRSGDWIEIQGNISSLRQKVDSMQLDNQPIQEAGENQEVGIRVIRPVKPGDAIIRLRG